MKTSPNFFSQLMVSMFAPLRLHTRAYIDNLVTATPDFDSMLEALCAGWDVLHANNVCMAGPPSPSWDGTLMPMADARARQMDELRLLAPPATVRSCNLAWVS